MNIQLCDPDRLDAFVRAELNEQQESDLTAHLDQCASCGEELERRIAAADQWKEASQLLTHRRAEQLGVVDSGRDSGEHGSMVASAAVAQQMEQFVDMLAPTDDPDMLGRIGGYEVSGVIGCGGMGVVFKAHDRSLDRVVAIKVMAPHLAGSGAARKRFARESKAAAAVLHPNVIAIHSVDADQKLPYLVMPYIGGESLQKRIQTEGPLCPQDTLRIGQQIAAGLAAAHAQGLVHRDIKPANILLERGVERVTITDFGLARAVDDATMTRSGVIAGTPQYMSPEQARGETIDHRSDLFSLGSVLYAMCTGHSPFRAETTFGVLRRITDNEPRPIREINPDVPDWLCAIIDKLHAKDASERFQSAEEVAELLEGCLAHVQQPATTPLPAPVAKLAKSFGPDGKHSPAESHGGFRYPPIGKLIGATAFGLSMIFAGVLIVLELNKGTLTIQCEGDDVPIRIMQGDKVARTLTVTRSGQSVRIAAGQYVVVIDDMTDGIVVQNGTVSLQRGTREIIRIVRSHGPDPAVGAHARETTDTSAPNDKVIVDVYCGEDVLPQMNTQGPNKERHVRFLQSLNAIEGVTTNFRMRGSGNQIFYVQVRDPSLRCRRETERTDEPSTIRTAINAATSAAGIERVGWQEGIIGSVDDEPIVLETSSHGGVFESETEAIENVAHGWSAVEDKVAKLVLVFAQDRSRRAVPCIVMSVGEDTFAVTTMPSTVVPDGTPHAIDKTWLEWQGDQRFPAKYISQSTSEFAVYGVAVDEVMAPLKIAAEINVGQYLSAVDSGRSERLRRFFVNVTAVDTDYELTLPNKKRVFRYTDLIEIDHSLPEGTPLFHDGKLAGFTLLGERFLGKQAKRSLVVPAQRLLGLRLKSRREEAEQKLRDLLEDARRTVMQDIGGLKEKLAALAETPESSPEAIRIQRQLTRAQALLEDIAKESRKLSSDVGTASPMKAANSVPDTLGSSLMPDNVSQLMQHIANPAMKDLGDAVNATPAAKRDWEVIKSKSLTISEVGNMLIQRAGRDQQKWTTFSESLRDNGKSLFEAANSRDIAIAKTHLTAISESCTNCHRAFRGRPIKTLN